jgi:hypothetical protein
MQLLVTPTSAWLFAEVCRVDYRTAPLASPDRTVSTASIVAVEVDGGRIRRVITSQAPRGVGLRLWRVFFWQGAFYLLDDPPVRLLRFGGQRLEEVSPDDTAELLSRLGIDAVAKDVARSRLDAVMRTEGWQSIPLVTAPHIDLTLVQPPLHIWWRESAGREQVVVGGISPDRPWKATAIDIDPRQNPGTPAAK